MSGYMPDIGRNIDAASIWRRGMLPRCRRRFHSNRVEPRPQRQTARHRPAGPAGSECRRGVSNRRGGARNCLAETPHEVIKRNGNQKATADAVFRACSTRPNRQRKTQRDGRSPAGLREVMGNGATAVVTASHPGARRNEIANAATKVRTLNIRAAYIIARATCAERAVKLNWRAERQADGRWRADNRPTEILVVRGSSGSWCPRTVTAAAG
jgi:hypothetical protein